MIYRERAQTPKGAHTPQESTQRKPRHKSNLHKQGLEQKTPCSAQSTRNLQRGGPSTKEIFTNKAQNINNLHKQGPDTKQIYTNKPQTHNKSAQTVPRTDESMQNNIQTKEIYREGAQTPRPRQRRNLHKQGPDK